MSTNFLTQSRHKSTYYFRRRIPTDIKHHFTNALIVKSLNTSNKKIAVILARNLASQTDNLFRQIREIDMKSDNYLGLTLQIDLDQNKQPTKILVDAQPHEEALANTLLSTVMNANSTLQNTIPAFTPKTSTVQEPIIDFQTHINEYFAKAGLKPNTVVNYKSKLRFARNHFGDNSNLLKINQQDIVKFSEHVKSEIKNPTTQGLYIQVVVSFINWHRIRNGDTSLTSSTLIPKRKTPEHYDRDEFSLEDMRAIFANAFTYSHKQPHKWWATLAVAFSGCRIEEICQVNLKTDLIHDQKNGIWYFKFDEEPDNLGDDRKSMKRLSSWRHMPIHSALINYGFIAYLKAQLKKGNTRPFECGWKPRVVAKENICKWSQYATKWGGRELKKLVSEELIEHGEKSYFHSMRHTVAKLMREAGVTSDISEAIAGRNAGAGEQERYGKIKNSHELLYREGIEKALNPLVEILELVIGHK